MHMYLQALIIMSKPPGNPEPNIPAVFVSQKAGIIMKKLLALDDIRVNITPVRRCRRLPPGLRFKVLVCVQLRFQATAY